MRSLPKNKKILYCYAAAVALLLLSLVLGVLLGASELRIGDIFAAIFGISPDTPETRIILFVRLPRVLASIICGAALSVAGAVMQGVLANRLATPSIIGVNSGAGLAVTLAASLGVVGFGVTLSAFLGALFAVMLVSFTAKSLGASRGTVILMGVALNSLIGAVTDAVISFVPEVGVSLGDFRVGDFSGVTYTVLFPAALVILAAIAVLLTLSGELDVLTLGDDSAKGLGLNADLMRAVFLLLVALLSGAAVSVSGLLSFVGLLVPHAVRRLVGGRAIRLLPLTALLGAALVSLSDTLARVIFAPYEIPVGIITAFIGAPFFIFILVGRRGDERDA